MVIIIYEQKPIKYIFNLVNRFLKVNVYHIETSQYFKYTKLIKFVITIIKTSILFLPLTIALSLEYLFYFFSEVKLKYKLYNVFC